MAISIPALNFKSNDAGKVGRTIKLVMLLRRINFTAADMPRDVPQAAKFLRSKFNFMERDEDAPGPIYWTLAARMLAS